MPERAIIRVPATTANLGPGYDCLGVALKLYNHVTVEQGAGAMGRDMAADAATAFFRAADLAPFTFQWSIAGEVPRSRGLGSSVTVRLGVLHGLNVLAGLPLLPEAIFHLCAELEGHPDNAAPACFGGFTVAGGEAVARFEVRPELKFVLLIPDFEVATPEARSVLPAHLDRLAAVSSCANACRITAAFASGAYETLRGAFADGLHQPFREALVPFLPRVIAAAEGAGALGGFLSGSGSTVCAVTLREEEAVGAAMQAAAGVDGTRIMVTEADNGGMQLAS